LGARFVEGVEQAGVKALLEEDVGGESGLHHPLKLQQPGFQAARIAEKSDRFRAKRAAASG
jgi:hypothetical protein